MGKLRQLNFVSFLNLVRLTASPASVKLHKGFFPAVLCKKGN